jgi:hypothetical protein
MARRARATGGLVAIAASVVLALIVLLRPAVARAADCLEAVSQENTQKLFDALAKGPQPDGCTLEEVNTDRAYVQIRWKKGERALDPVLVVPSSCATTPTVRGPVLSTMVPPFVSDDCSAEIDALDALVQTDAFGKLVPVAGAIPVPEGAPARLSTRLRHYLPRGLIGVGLALVVVAAGARIRYRRRARASPSLAGPREGGVVEGPTAGPRPRLSLPSWLRRAWQRNPSQAGWWAAALIGPHLALGTWLVVVPDHLAFTTAQIVTLVHVGLAVIAFPVATIGILIHVRRMRAGTLRSPAYRAVRWALTAATVVAAVTGIIALWGGDIVQPAAVHAWCGVAVAVPLAAHLWMGFRRFAAGAVLALLAIATLGSMAARTWLPPATLAASIPAFDYATRPSELYEPAENCGECHEQDYRDWKRSTHARTLGLETVRESMEKSPDLLAEDLAHVGQLIREPERPVSAALVFGACGSCHAPTSFYGDGHPSLLRATGVTAEGTGCSFCHTLREVRQDRSGGQPAVLDPRSFSRADIFATMSRAPFYVSAPETVRRYFFQGSRSALARTIANYLIRWRPAVHSADYHSPVLDDSRACLACHSLGIDSPDVPHMTYYGWEHSAFNTGDPKTTVQCQDCHMVRRMTGKPVNESAKQVDWGPSRPGARSHLFLGGNVAVARTSGDTGMAELEHELNTQAATVEVTRVQPEGDELAVTVNVKSLLVGHFFPALETRLRFGWVELKAVDAAGAVLASTRPPKDSEDFGCPSPLIMASVTDTKAGNQRLLPPGGERELVGRIALPPGAKVDAVVAELHQFVDPSPIATTRMAVHAP